MSYLITDLPAYLQSFFIYSKPTILILKTIIVL